METWETVSMTRKEVRRPGLVQAALAGKITTAEGARAVGVSQRQFRRLKARYRTGGSPGLMHQGRGRPSPRALESGLQTQVADLLRTNYSEFNDCHCTEMLHEVHGLAISRSTVRRLRRALGLAAKRRRRPPRHRTRRPRRPAMGSLVLIDGSPFDWLGTGPLLFLLGAIDDATGTILALHFRPAEDLHGYLTLLGRIAAVYGLPVSLYGDRLGVFVRNDAHWTLAEELQGEQDPTHFGQILAALGIGYITAHSPQAKGRVERLWGTLQDRLVAEFRLRGIRTFEAAEAFLPTYMAAHNRRFAVPPATPAAVWRRPPRDLADWLSCCYTRKVAKDNTVRLGPRLVQIPRGRHGRAYAGCRVTVRECLDGRVLVEYQNQRLATADSPGPAFVLQPRRVARLRAAQTRAREGGRSLSRGRNPAVSPVAALTELAQHLRRPARRHPWRRTFSARQRERNRRQKTPRGRTFSLNS